MQLKRRPNVIGCVRRIHVRETVEVPAGMQVYVPVDLAHTSLIVPRTDWMTEARAMKHGLFARGHRDNSPGRETRQTKFDAVYHRRP
jgi:hypothetical protein